MKKNKSNRGGAREGAGRKATGRTKKTITLCLSYDVIEMLNAHAGNKSASSRLFVPMHYPSSLSHL